MPSRPHRLPPVASWRIEGSTYRWTDPTGRAYTIAPDNFGGARRFSAQIRDTRHGGVHHVGGGKTPEEAYKLLAAVYSRGRTKRASDKRMTAAMNKAVMTAQPVFQRQGAAFEAEWKRDQARLARSAALTARLAARRKNPRTLAAARSRLAAAQEGYRILSRGGDLEMGWAEYKRSVAGMSPEAILSEARSAARRNPITEPIGYTGDDLEGHAIPWSREGHKRIRAAVGRIDRAKTHVEMYKAHTDANNVREALNRKGLGAGRGFPHEWGNDIGSSYMAKYAQLGPTEEDVRDAARKAALAAEKERARAKRTRRANPEAFRKGDHVMTTGGSAGVVQSFEMHDRVSNTDWYIVLTTDRTEESWPASGMRKVAMSKAARGAAAMGRMLGAKLGAKRNPTAPAALPTATRPFRGRYVLPAEEDLQPAVTYTSEVFAIGGVLYADVQKHEPGFPPAEIFDGRVADLRGTLHYDSRVRKHQLAPLLRALLGAYAPKRKAA